MRSVKGLKEAGWPIQGTHLGSSFEIRIHDTEYQLKGHCSTGAGMVDLCKDDVVLTLHLLLLVISISILESVFYLFFFSGFLFLAAWLSLRQILIDLSCQSNDDWPLSLQGAREGASGQPNNRKDKESRNEIEVHLAGCHSQIQIWIRMDYNPNCLDRLILGQASRDRRLRGWLWRDRWTQSGEWKEPTNFSSSSFSLYW